MYTRKVTTDVSYLACVGRLFKYNDLIYPQFATHNAHSIAAVLELAPANANFEFQRLHGMGRLLYAEAARQVTDFPPVRVYAPVGEHKDLLAYLVRRLLENGANTSFVNRFMDDQVPVVEIVRDPISELERLDSYAHPRLPLPAALYSDRRNSRGIDLGDPRELETLRVEISTHRAGRAGSLNAGPIINGQLLPGKAHAVTNPADRRDQVGGTRDATPEEIKLAFDAGAAAQSAWNASGGDARADCLEKAAQLLESDRAAFHELLVREAGKTVADAISEVREAVDFCRYYALRARKQFAAAERLEGPTGETNELMLAGRGVFACISPWNFPLAIFAGQVSAALAAGNAVVAKPAEPTPLIAARFIRLLHQAGVPPQAAAPGADARTLVRRSCAGASGACRRRDDRLDGHGADDQSCHGRARRNYRAADRRDRRTECHDRGFNRAPGTSGRRCGELGVHERRPALFGAAPAVFAGRNRRRGIGDDRRRHGRVAHRRSSQPADRRGPGHQRGGTGWFGSACGKACKAMRAS